MTMPPASLEGDAVFGATTGRRLVDRDPLDGGGVSDRECRSTLDCGPEPLLGPLPMLLPVPVPVAGGMGTIPGRAGVPLVTGMTGLRSGSPETVSAEALRSDDRRGGSARGLPDVVAVVVSHVASESATS